MYDGLNNDLLSEDTAVPRENRDLSFSTANLHPIGHGINVTLFLCRVSWGCLLQCWAGKLIVGASIMERFSLRKRQSRPAVHFGHIREGAQ